MISSKSFVVKSLFLVVIALSLWGVSFSKFDNNNWLEKDNPAEINEDILKHKFGQGEVIAVSVGLNQDFFSKEVISRVRKITTSFTNKSIDKILTPLSADFVLAKDASLNLKSFDKMLLENILSLEEYKEKFFHSIYADQLISKDKTRFIFQIKLKANIDNDSIDAVRKNIVNQINASFLSNKVFTNIKFVGNSWLQWKLNNVSQSEIFIFSAIVLLLCFFFVFIFLNNSRQSLIILIGGTSSVLISIALIALLKHPLTIISMSIPIIVIIISTADSFHIISRFNLKTQKFNKNNTIEETEKAYKTSILDCYKPCFYSSATTAIGLGSFIFSDIVPLHIFGVDAIVASLTTYVVTMFCLFLGMSFLSKNRLNIKSNLKIKKFDAISFLAKFGNKLIEFIHNQKVSIAIVSFVLFSFSCFMLSKAYTETGMLDMFFAKDSQTYQNLDSVDKEFGGIGSINILFSADKGFFKTIDSLNKIKKLQEELSKLELVRNSYSLTTPISMLHKEIRKDDSLLPNSSEKLAQELLFLEMSRSESSRGILASWVDFSYSSARIEVQTSNLSSKELEVLIGKVLLMSKKEFPNIKIRLAGANVYFHSLNSKVLYTQLVSIFVTLFVCLFMFVLQFGFKKGILAVTATMLPVLIVAGFISLLKIPFDIATVMIASVAFGLCIDDIVHFMHKYTSVNKSLSIKDKIQATLVELSPAIIITSLVFIGGFITLALSDLVILQKFGVFTSLAIFLATLATLILLPAFFLLFDKKQEERGI